MLFKRKAKLSTFNVEINNKSMTQVNDVRYFRVILDNKLSWDKHINQIIKKLSWVEHPQNSLISYK